MNNHINLQNSIIKTLAFYGLWQKALEKKRLYSLIGVKCTFFDFEKTLENLINGGRIFSKNNIFALKKAHLEFKNADIVNKLCKKARKMAKILSFVPFLESLLLINSVAFETANKHSDIDILLITRRNRMWTARFFTVLLLEFFGVNKQKNKIAGRFCLGFAFDTGKINLKSLRLLKDDYLTHWLASSRPLIGYDAYNKFLKANSWLKDELPNWRKPDGLQSTVYNLRKTLLKKMLEGKLGDFVEEKLAAWQMKRAWADPKSLRKGASVIITKNMLKLHPYDKRPIYQKALDKKLSTLLK